MKRKIVSILIVLTLIFSYIPSFSYETYGDFSYILEGDEVVITGYTGNSSTVNIPSRIEGMNVVKISSFAFAYKDITAVTVPYTVKTIETGAFYFCNSLKSVNISEGTVYIKDRAFSGCISLNKITLPESLLYIGAESFSGCNSLLEITIPGSVEYIGLDSFYDMNEDFVLYGYDNSIAYDYAIENGFSFESLGEYEREYIASGIIGDIEWSISMLGVFKAEGSGELSWTDSIYPPWNEYSEDIKTVEIKEGITSVGQYAFYNCENLTSVSLPESIEKIERYAFSGCIKLANINIPSNISEIGDFCFEDCAGIKFIALPDSVTYLGQYAFSGCSSLLSVSLSEGITEIKDSLFYNCSKLKKIEVPESVKYINNYAFGGCSNLSQIILNDGLLSIYNYVFSGCNSLSEISFPKTVSYIGDELFRQSTSIPVIKGYNKSVAEEFATENGYTFESLGDLPVEIIHEGECGDNITFTLDTYGKLILSGSGKTYDYSSGNTPWASYTVSEIVVESGITYLGDYIFANTAAEKVTLKSGLTEIGYYSFSSMRNLTEIEIPDGVTTIGSCAFYRCTNLLRVNIPDTVISIAYDYYTFSFRACNSELVVYGYSGSAVEYACEENSVSFSGVPYTSEKIVLSGKYENINYTISNKGKLVLSADSGAKLVSYYDYPWNSITTILQIEFNENITELGYRSISNYGLLKKVTFSGYVNKIDEDAFFICSDNFVVSGYNGGAGEEFAKLNGYTFESLGDLPEMVIASGNYSDTVTWEITNTGILTVKGEGEIPGGTPEWYGNYANIVKKVIITDGITKIGSSAFEYADGITEVVVPYTVSQIEYYAFSYSTLIKGLSGSVAEYWAEEQGYSFESIGEMPQGVILATEECGNNAVYTLYTDGRLVVSGTGSVYNTINYYHRKIVKSAVIEDGITSFSCDFFSECINLSSVEFSKTVSGYSNGLFMNCSSLTKVTLPPFTTLSNYLFYNCSSLTEVVVSSGTTYLQSMVFYDCPLLEKIVLPTSVTSIASNFAQNCSDNLIIYGYDGLTVKTYLKNYGYTFVSLGKEPFTGASGVYNNFNWSITADGVFTISGDGNIYETYSDYPWSKYKDDVVKAVFSEGITNLPMSCFYNFSALTEVVIPESALYIGSDAFSNCRALNKININDGLLEIRSWAFNGCSSLKEITIPVNTTIGNYAFSSGIVIRGYTGSPAYRYAMKNSLEFESLGVLEKEVVKEGKCGEYITWTYNNYGELIISGEGYMYDWYDNNSPWRELSVEKVIIEEGIYYIGAYAFYGMNSIYSLSLPETLWEVGEYAFYDCYRIPFIYMPEDLHYIGNFAFNGVTYGMALKENVEYIGPNAFSYGRIYAEPGGYVEYYCSDKDNLTFIPAYSEGECGDYLTWSFDIYDRTLNIEGFGVMYDYADDYGWSIAPWYEMRGDIEEINLSDNIVYIGRCAFESLMYAKEIVLPSALDGIGDGAFINTRFNEIEIPDGCSFIGNRAFEATYIKKITIPESVIEMGAEVFNYSDDIVIYTKKGSYVEQYAREYNIPVEYLKEKPEITSINAEYYKNAVVLVDVIVSGIDGCAAYCAVYGENDEMLSIGKLYITESGARAEIPVENAKRVKCFVWNSLSDMTPLCNPMGAELILTNGSSSGTATGGAGGINE